MSRHDDSRATSEERSSLGLRVARKAGGASLVVAAVLLLFVVGGSLAAWTFSTEPPGAQTVNSAVLQSPYEATGGPVSAALPPAGTWNAPAQLQGSDAVEGVSCPDAGMCWAVGYGGPSTSTDALVAQWNAGSGWGTPFTPQGVSSSDSTLGAVSCPTPGLCWAVGSDSDGSFAVEWAPASGWQQPVPLPHLSFNAVSCPDAAMCFASGSETGSTGLLVGAVISWTSSSGWGTPQTVQGSSVLDSIACPSTTACFAVGQAFAGSSIEDVAASWEAGSGWGSATALSSSDILNAVACPSSSMCLAVGESTSATPSGVAVEWTPTSGWQSPVTVAGSEYLNGVSCSASSECLAVGYTENSSSEQGVAAQWTSTTGWGAAAELGAGTVYPYGVSCPSTAMCWVAGAATSSTLGEVQQWTGAPGWGGATTVAASGQGSSDTTSLDDISCPSESFCLAVGQETPSSGGGDGVFSEWTSSSGWSAAAELGAGTVYPHGISCPSTTMCWMVGTGPAGAAAEEWTSTGQGQGAWGPVVSISGSDNLYDVSCPSTSFCMAVGEDGTASDNTNAVATSWTPSGGWQTAAVVPGVAFRLYQVSCPSSSLCWATGFEQASSGVEHVASEWTGTGWSTAAVLPGDIQPAAISCPSTTTCWAIGVDSSGNSEALAWSSASGWGTPSALPGPVDYLSCPTVSFCTAAGAESAPSGSGSEVYAAQWTGSSWDTESFGIAANFLQGLSCPDQSLCWLVGQGASRAHLVQWQPPSIEVSWAPPPTPSVDYDGNPLYPDLIVSRSDASGTSCPASGYSPVDTVPTGPGASSSASWDDTDTSPGGWYCYQLSYQDQDWTSPATTVGPLPS